MSTPSETAVAAVRRPLRRDAERNRARIIDAARAVFSQRGLDVTLDEIAREAGVGVATVYRRFSDKDALVHALFEERIAEIAAIADDALGDPDPWRGLVGFFERSLGLHAADRGLRELLFTSPHGGALIAGARARLEPLVGELVARAKASGDLRADVEGPDVPLIQFMVTSVLDYTDGIAPGQCRRFLGIVLDGLRTRREAPTPLAAPPLSHDELGRAMRGTRRRVAR